jgi:hypothetical protein
MRSQNRYTKQTIPGSLPFNVMGFPGHSMGTNGGLRIAVVQLPDSEAHSGARNSTKSEARSARDLAVNGPGKKGDG